MSMIMSKNISHTGPMVLNEIPSNYQDILERNPDLSRQLALYAFYGDLCQKTNAPIDWYLGMFIKNSEIFFQQLDKAPPDQKKWFIASVKLDEFLLRKTFLHYWDLWSYGGSFFASADRNSALRQYLSGTENEQRIGLSGETFIDVLKLTETKEDRARKQSMDDDIIRAIKNLIRERYLVEQRIFFKLLGENGGSSATTSQVGDKISGIL